ncbi:hypothetical protein ACFP9V_03490 [Deinococcus radiopugnans]|uniref:hypothetical protein n=1 Tax=Deinococcus radiopugnans TaxID=57497 RepID=UPI00361EC225
MTDTPVPPPSQPVQATHLLTHLQGVTQALTTARQQDEVCDIVLRDALDILWGIGGTVLLVRDAHLHVAARRGQTDGSVWQAGDLTGGDPCADALRSNTPCTLTTQARWPRLTRTWKPGPAGRPQWPARCCPWWKAVSRWA